MKHASILVAAALALSFNVAQADDKGANPQQNRMAQCNKQAEGKKGDERKQFMSQCLSNKPAAAPGANAAPNAACEKAAAEKNLHGAAKGSFVKKCEQDAKTGAPKK